MEDLSDTVNNPMLNSQLKREKSLKSKCDLYNVCSDKIVIYFKELSTKSNSSNSTLQISKTLCSVFEGYKSIIESLQEGFVQAV